MVDQIEMEDMPNPSLVKLVANDGTSFLKTIRQVPTSTHQQGQASYQSQCHQLAAEHPAKNSHSCALESTVPAKIPQSTWTDFHPKMG